MKVKYGKGSSRPYSITPANQYCACRHPRWAKVELLDRTTLFLCLECNKAPRPNYINQVKLMFKMRRRKPLPIPRINWTSKHTFVAIVGAAEIVCLIGLF